MLNLKIIRKAALVIGATLFAVGPTAFAHTTILNQMTEGTTADNALKIGHGCATPAGYMLPVIAQSAVFPTVAPQVTASDGSAIANLSDVIVQGSIAGLLSPIQNRDIFQQQQLKLDALGNKIGFSGTKGSLAEPGWLGRVPWQFAPPKFVATSCANRLLIKVAIVDICIRQIGGYDEGYVNFWIPDNGSAYAMAAHALHNDEGVGAPATLTINRNLATNPLPAACGAGMDVTVTPSPDDVDTNLPIPGYWE
jgi:hypothetical protein